VIFAHQDDSPYIMSLYQKDFELNLEEGEFPSTEVDRAAESIIEACLEVLGGEMRKMLLP